ncbi:ATP-grasp domain-containing protein [Thiothrix nivea]|uniref:ATP-grasp domain-containing protein n=1 Tax=Thiothrix nivea (strain ATCC 35100 / DSM 5205 / JP2) TaxID=870187 RepID=A0A656HJF9_THINJ|nr:hypothetical protein [Thiothrix nivea]EIJ36342.1 hypothetical protein Thini_3842 [Thiothrix nivea DSM 5205]
MSKTSRLLIAGGDTDPQLVRLLKRAAMHGIPVHCLLTGQSGSPRLHWDIRNNCLLDDGGKVAVSAAFIRQDVFAYLKSNNTQDSAAAREWYVAVSGWLLATPGIRIFNRAFLPCGSVNKPYVLRLAMEMGFHVADTFVSNDIPAMNALHDSGAWITKPVTGGSYCSLLEKHAGSVNNILSYPQIVQQRLEQPELRVFRIGDAWFGFRVLSEALDYRTSSATRLQVTEAPGELVEKLAQLSGYLGLDFAAADFKTDPATGKLQFLEINTNPMFAGFDQVAAGALSDAMLRYLGVLPE